MVQNDLSETDLLERVRRLEEHQFESGTPSDFTAGQGKTTNLTSLTSTGQTTVGSLSVDDAAVPHSLAVWMVYKDGSEVVAVDDTGNEVNRGTDARAVFQDAINQANDKFDPNKKFEPVVLIDGGFREYTIDDPLVVKDGAVVQNARFDLSGLGASEWFTVGGPNDGYTHGAARVRNIVFRDPANRVRLRDLVHVDIGPIVIENAANVGLEIQSCIGCRVRAHINQTGAEGILVNSNGETAGKSNVNDFWFRANGCSSSGVRMGGDTSGNRAMIISENNGDHGISGFGRDNLYIAPWVESNGNRGMLLQGTRPRVIHPTLWDNNGGGGDTQGIRVVGCDRSVVTGPLGGNDDMVVASGADNRVDNVSPSNVIADNATRTRWDGIIAGGPSGGTDIGSVTGASEGDLARGDGTTGSADAVYILKSTGDWQALHDPATTITPS